MKNKVVVSIIALLCYALPAQAVLNMGSHVIYRGTTIEVIQPGFFTLQSIIDGITDASADKPYLIKLGPGVYTNLATIPVVTSIGLTMKPYISVMGSGQGVTILKGAVSDSSEQSNSAIISGDNNTMISHLSLENTGGDAYSVGIFSSAASPHIENITITVSGASTGNYGIYNGNSSSPMINDTLITVSGAATNNHGVFNQSTSSPIINNVIATVSGATGDNRGVSNLNSSTPVMNNVTINVSGAATTNYGVFNSNSSPTMYRIVAIVSGGTFNYGMQNAATLSSPKVDSSILNGTTAGADFNFSSGSRITNTQIVGGVGTDALATTQCRNTYDATLANVSC